VNDKPKVKPVKEIDLNKVSVYQLIGMLERGDKDAYYMMMSLRAAEARGLRDIRGRTTELSD
jgi:hypothetical protein